MEHRKAFRESLCLWMTKGHVAALQWSGASGPAGVGVDTRKRTMGFPRNLADPAVSSAKSRLEIPGDQLQAWAAHSPVQERKERVNLRYRQAKATKRGGMGARKS
jgi:hypothetical protein